MEHRQFFRNMYASLMTVLSRAHFQGSFSPEQFGGTRPGPVRIEDYFTQTVEQKKSNLRTMLRAAGAAAERKKAVKRG